MSNTWARAAKDGFQAVKLQRPGSGHRVQSLLGTTRTWPPHPAIHYAPYNATSRGKIGESV